MNSLVLCLCLCTFGAFAVKKLPPYVNVCKRTDPEISKCWQKTLLELKPYLAKGIPEFNVDPVSSFRVEKIHLDQASTRNVNFMADLVNLTFKGAENFEVPYTTANFADTSALYLNEGITFPQLTMRGRYKAKGRVLLFEFEGEGEVEGKFDDVKVNGTWHLKLIKKKGRDHLQIDQDIIDVHPGKMFLYLHDLFKESPEITKNVNNAINENVDVLYEDFKPLLQTTMSAILNQYINRVYSIYPFDILLPAE